METFLYLVMFIVILVVLLLCVTTRYEFDDTFLVIWRLGTEWRRIHFKDIENIEVGYAFLDKSRQVKYFQPRIGKMTRIKKKGWNRYILINPKDPQPLLEAVERYKSAHSSG